PEDISARWQISSDGCPESGLGIVAHKQRVTGIAKGHLQRQVGTRACWVGAERNLAALGGELKGIGIARSFDQTFCASCVVVINLQVARSGQRVAGVVCSEAYVI